MHEDGAALAYLRSHLVETGLRREHVRPGRIDGGELGVVGSFALIVVLFGDQTVLKETLTSFPIESCLFQVGLCLQQVGLRGLVACFASLNSGFSGVDGGRLSLYVGVGLDVFLSQEDLTLLNVVAFLDHDRRDPAKSLRGHIGIRSGLDFSRGGDLGDQTLLWSDLRGLHGDHALIRLVYAKEHNSAENRHGADANTYFLPRLHGVSSWLAAAKPPARDFKRACRPIPYIRS